MSLITRLAPFLLGADSGDGSGLAADDVLDKLDSEVRNFERWIEPAETSRPRTRFGGSPAGEMTFVESLRMMPIFLPLMRAMRRSAAAYDGVPQPAAVEASPEFLAELEDMALRAGAADIHYVRVPRTAIFEDKGLPQQNAIVFTVEMDSAPISTAPSFEAMREVMTGYRRLARISNQLADLLRENGFAAYPGTALGGLTDYPHLAELAGLGAIGYHGLLIAPGQGARLRINTIYTNISNLPIETDNQHLWVRDFCAMCRKCIRACPVEAIFDQPRPRGDGGMQCIDHDACRIYFRDNYGCAICLAVCPFSQVGYEKVKERFKGNPEAPRYRIPVATAAAY